VGTVIVMRGSEDEKRSGDGGKVRRRVEPKLFNRSKL
jgi:hypothetical protein